MKRILFSMIFCLLSGLVFSAEPFRTTSNFNDGWIFQLVKSDGVRQAPVNSKRLGDSLDKEKLEQGQEVRLPHDWAISGPFDQAGKDGGQGKLPWRGVGLYTKTFKLDEKDFDKAVIFNFGGCMAFPEVYINGKYAGGWDYGYLGFQVNATPYVKYNADNIIQVRCDTRKHGSRWYPGAGIYRSVQMITCSKEVWLPMGSVFFSTKSIIGDEAVLNFEINPESRADLPLNAVVTIQCPGRKSPITVRLPLLENKRKYDVTITNPVLWTVENPVLYTITVKVYVGKMPCDEISFPFGIRTVKFTADDGFYLNGKRLQLYGVDLHHDQGILGAASHPAAIERQLRIMKDMGVNAIRTSHNPNSPEFMDACDRLGLIVWNELFDKWNSTADLIDQKEFDSFMDRQVRQFIHRDQNRPSVCLWSIGNEIFDVEENRVGDSNPFNDAARRVKYVADCFRKYDTTRQIAFGCCVSGTCNNGVRDSVDVTGWNYRGQYQIARKCYPKMPLVYSESASAVSTRGYYEIPHPDKKDVYNMKTIQVDGYDFSAVPWGDIPDPEFDRMEKDTYCAGEFVWTGFDYLGEPSPFNAEARSSYFGIVDLCGIPKDRFFLYRSYWNPKETTVHLLPHWNWEKSSIKKIPVYVYTNGDSAELFLNGKSLGKRAKLKEIVDPINIAMNTATKVTASTEEKKDGSGIYNAAGNVLLPEDDKRWCASSEDPNQWLLVDLGSEKSVTSWKIKFEKECTSYQFVLLTSSDNKEWKEVFNQKNFDNWKEQIVVQFNGKPIKARYFKVVFKALKPGAWASIRSFVLNNLEVRKQQLPDYYNVIDKYRLRWEDVDYQPGVLEAVAYRDGKEIGRNRVKTGGTPAKILLKPEKNAFNGNDDLVYIQAEVVDKDGNLCPWDTRTISISLDGPATLVGIGNGNPMGYDLITDAKHPLFYGKAMIVLRSGKGSGTVQLKVTAEGVDGSFVELKK